MSKEISEKDCRSAASGLGIGYVKERIRVVCRQESRGRVECDADWTEWRSLRFFMTGGKKSLKETIQDDMMQLEKRERDTCYRES